MKEKICPQCNKTIGFDAFLVTIAGFIVLYYVFFALICLRLEFDE